MTPGEGVGTGLLRALMASAAAGLLAGTAPAADDSQRQQAEQRLKLASQLLADAATAQRIAGSGQSRAVSHVDEARVHLARAEQALAAADWAAARQESNEALRHIATARRMVPDAPARLAQQQRRVEQRLASIDRLLQAWSQRLSERSPGQAADADGRAATDRLAAIGLVESARQLSGEGRLDDALQQLALAETHLLSGMNHTLAQRTLDYSHRAGTPAEALRLALDQHAGLAELLPLALAELKPPADAQQLVERYADAGRMLRLQALQRQQRGELVQALADVHNAVLYAQRALAAAGVAMPAPSDGTP